MIQSPKPGDKPSALRSGGMLNRERGLIPKWIPTSDTNSISGFGVGSRGGLPDS